LPKVKEANISFHDYLQQVVMAKQLVWTIRGEGSRSKKEHFTSELIGIVFISGKSWDLNWASNGEAC
jgi:hypothetical protein